MKPTIVACAFASVVAGCIDSSSSSDGSGTETTPAAPQFSADKPCGADTVTSLASGASKLTFCVAGHVEMLLEDRPVGTSSVLEARALDVGSSCLVDIFRALAPDRVVPPALVASCAERPPITRTPIQRPAPKTADAAGTTYCTAGGEQRFINDWCSIVARGDFGGGPDTVWCLAPAMGWHQETASTELGGDGADNGYDFIVSCGGDTRFRGWLADDVGDAWNLRVDLPVTDGHELSWAVTADDDDIRVRGDSAAGAFHRATGYFIGD